MVGWRVLRYNKMLLIGTTGRCIRARAKMLQTRFAMPALIKSWVLKSAALAVPLLIASTTASAQYRINDNDGRVLDANNRLGSGGHNTGRDLRLATPTGNDIVTGNVTGLRHFHGRVDYTDPRAFRGNAAGSRQS